MLRVHFFEPLYTCVDKLSIKKVFHFWPSEIATSVRGRYGPSRLDWPHMHASYYPSLKAKSGKLFWCSFWLHIGIEHTYWRVFFQGGAKKVRLENSKEGLYFSRRTPAVSYCSSCTQPYLFGSEGSEGGLKYSWRPWILFWPAFCWPRYTHPY